MLYKCYCKFESDSPGQKWHFCTIFFQIGVQHEAAGFQDGLKCEHVMSNIRDRFDKPAVWHRIIVNDVNLNSSRVHFGPIIEERLFHAASYLYILIWWESFSGRSCLSLEWRLSHTSISCSVLVHPRRATGFERHTLTSCECWSCWRWPHRVKLESKV